MRAWAIAVVVCALGGTAHADFWREMFRDVQNWQGATWLHYEATVLTAVDVTDRAERDPPRADQLILAGARLHGLAAAGSTVTYHIGLDLAAGGTIDGGGFAYDVAIYPIGIGVRFGRTSFAALGAGVGAMGATGTIDDAITMPLDLTAEFGGGRPRLLMRARATYIAAANSRQSSSPSLPFADEFEAMAALRIGRHYEEYNFPSGNGNFVGVAYRELAGVRYAGLVIGFSIDACTPRKKYSIYPGHRAPSDDRWRSTNRRGDVILIDEE